MLQDLEQHKKRIAVALQKLDTALERLTNALAHRDLWIRIDGADSRLAVQRACASYSAIDYGMSDAVNETVVCVGVIGAPADVIATAHAVNTAKDALKAACTPLQGVRTKVARKDTDGAVQSIQLVRVVLRSLQRSDLNLLAAYRKIPILDRAPASVTYTEARTRPVYRMTVADIETRLMNLTSAAASQDRAKLASLGPRVTHLAWVKEHYTNTRANIVYHGLDKRGRGRIQIAAELPILYPLGRHPEPPEVRFVSQIESDGAERRPRTSKLEDQPFLLSVPVYRYKS